MYTWADDDCAEMDEWMDGWDTQMKVFAMNFLYKFFFDFTNLHLQSIMAPVLQRLVALAVSVLFRLLLLRQMKLAIAGDFALNHGSVVFNHDELSILLILSLPI